MSMIEIRNLVKRYKDTIALDHLNLDIEEGEIFGLLGSKRFGKNHGDQLPAGFAEI